MKKIYTVYQLNDKRNKLGNPYIGFTENLIVRAKAWKYKLNLDYIPKLICLYTDTSAQRAFDWEQDKRVENGWTRERPLRHLRTMSKKAGIAASKSEKIKENCRKLGIKKTSNKEHQSNAGKIGGKIGGKIVGKKNVESGHLDKISKLGIYKSTSIERTCPHCSKTIKGRNYFKWHGDNCKLKQQQ